MNIWAWFLAGQAKEKQHWIWVVVFIALAILISVRGIMAIRNKRVRLKYGIVKEGRAAVVWGVFFVIAGVVLTVIAVVVHFKGPLV